MENGLEIGKHGNISQSHNIAIAVENLKYHSIKIHSKKKIFFFFLEIALNPKLTVGLVPNPHIPVRGLFVQLFKSAVLKSE